MPEINYSRDSELPDTDPGQWEAVVEVAILHLGDRGVDFEDGYGFGLVTIDIDVRTDNIIYSDN